MSGTTPAAPGGVGRGRMMRKSPRGAAATASPARRGGGEAFLSQATSAVRDKEQSSPPTTGCSPVVAAVPAGDIKSNDVLIQKKNRPNYHIGSIAFKAFIEEKRFLYERTGYAIAGNIFLTVEIVQSVLSGGGRFLKECNEQDLPAAEPIWCEIDKQAARLVVRNAFRQLIKREKKKDGATSSGSSSSRKMWCDQHLGVDAEASTFIDFVNYFSAAEKGPSFLKQEGRRDEKERNEKLVAKKKKSSQSIIQKSKRQGVDLSSHGTRTATKSVKHHAGSKKSNRPRSAPISSYLKSKEDTGVCASSSTRTKDQDIDTPVGETVNPNLSLENRHGFNELQLRVFANSKPEIAISAPLQQADRQQGHDQVPVLAPPFQRHQQQRQQLNSELNSNVFALAQQVRRHEEDLVARIRLHAKLISNQRKMLNYAARLQPTVDRASLPELSPLDAGNRQIGLNQKSAHQRIIECLFANDSSSTTL